MGLYLAHHGIKGQKWGIRRYQNEDGSLTPLGQKRYRRYKEIEESGKFGEFYERHKSEANEIEKQYHAKMEPYEKKFNDAIADIEKRQQDRARRYDEEAKKIQKKHLSNDKYREEIRELGKRFTKEGWADSEKYDELYDQYEKETRKIAMERSKQLQEIHAKAVSEYKDYVVSQISSDDIQTGKELIELFDKMYYEEWEKY